MRDLTIDEVHFDLSIEPEDIDPRGNTLAWGEPEDTEYVDEIIRRLDAGDEAAWCVVCVKATPKDGRLLPYRGFASLGGCTIGDGWQPGPVVERAAWQIADAHGMRAEALADLNRSLRAAVNEAKEIEEVLK